MEIMAFKTGSASTLGLSLPCLKSSSPKSFTRIFLTKASVAAEQHTKTKTAIIRIMSRGRDGQAAIIALEHIGKGEEITISYIDEELPFEERLELLEDYDFTCKCPKCSEEA